jgi:lantibiotic biosynthesis protein
LKDSFYKEFDVTQVEKKQIDKRYREFRPLSDQVMATIQLENNELFDFLQILTVRNQAMQPIVEKIMAKNQQKQLQVALDEYIASLIHMSINRAISAQQRFHELFIYDFLCHFYESENARVKKQLNKS